MLFGVWLLYCAFGLVVTSLAPLVGPIVESLGLSHAQMGSVLGAWQLVYIVSSVPCGVLLDRLGARFALLLAALVIAASAAGRALAGGYVELLLAVMLFGLAGPIVSAGAPKVIAQWFEGRDRGLAMGIYMTGPSIGGVVSLMLTHSVLMPAFSGEWRSVLQLWAGFALGVGLLWFAIASAPRARAMERDERTQKRPPQRETIATLLRDPTVLLMLAMSVGVFMFNHGLNNWLPSMLASEGMTPTQAGYWASIPTLIGIVGSLTIPRLATPGRRFTILLLLALAATAATFLLHSHSRPVLLAGLLMQGIARSALMTVLMLALIELPAIGARHAGIAAGLFFAAAEVGGVLGPVSLGALYDLTGGFDAALHLLSAVTIGLCVGAVLLRRAARRGGVRDGVGQVEPKDARP
ncbi:MAG: CynX/NimT family MFS transporter [Lautropia sp.]